VLYRAASDGVEGRVPNAMVELAGQGDWDRIQSCVPLASHGVFGTELPVFEDWSRVACGAGLVGDRLPSRLRRRGHDAVRYRDREVAVGSDKLLSETGYVSNQARSESTAWRRSEVRTKWFRGLSELTLSSGILGLGAGRTVLGFSSMDATEVSEGAGRLAVCGQVAFGRLSSEVASGFDPLQPMMS